jgi:hypothetical protein
MTLAGPVCRNAPGTGVHSANRGLFFSPPELHEASVSVTEYTLQLGGSHETETGQREQ